MLHTASPYLPGSSVPISAPSSIRAFYCPPLYFSAELKGLLSSPTLSLFFIPSRRHVQKQLRQRCCHLVRPTPAGPRETSNILTRDPSQLSARSDIPGRICTGGCEARIRGCGIGEQDTCRPGRTQGSPYTRIFNAIRARHIPDQEAKANHTLNNSVMPKNSPPIRRRSSRSTRTWPLPLPAWPRTPASFPTS